MKIGRNAPCPCGSGKKYKKCCLAKDQQTGRSHQNNDDLIQPTPHGADGKMGDSGIRIRPYVVAKMCDPTEKHVQDFLASHPELDGKSLITLSHFRTLSTEQLIKQLSEQGINYNQDQFIAMCEKKDSAWDVADALWPKQAISRNADVSDIVGLSGCILWKRLYDEEKMTKVSVEMLDDWMQDGYKESEKDIFKGCRIWLKVWETFKNDYDLANRSIEEIDYQFIGTQSFFNWCQDFEMHLINASLTSKEYAKFGIDYLSEFLTYFADEDDSLVNNFKQALGECYCRSGDQEAGEKVSRELIQQYPNRMVGYISMEMALLIREKNGQSGTYEKRLKILEEAKKYPVIDGKDYDLDSRISDLKQKTANFEKRS